MEGKQGPSKSKGCAWDPGGIHQQGAQHRDANSLNCRGRSSSRGIRLDQDRKGEMDSPQAPGCGGCDEEGVIEDSSRFSGFHHRVGE